MTPSNSYSFVLEEFVDPEAVKIHEYQAKAILREFGIPVPPGEVADTPADAKAIAQRIPHRVVMKAQIHAGGRGKAGGIKLAGNPIQVEQVASEILGMRLKTPQTPPEGIASHGWQRAACWAVRRTVDGFARGLAAAGRLATGHEALGNGAAEYEAEVGALPEQGAVPGLPRLQHGREGRGGGRGALFP